MKIYMPLLIAVMSLVILNLLIVKNQTHLDQNPSLFVALQPVDPRSLIQGDYMVLNYNLNFPDSTNAEINQAIHNKMHVLAYVELDQNHVVTKSDFSAKTFKNAHKLMLKNPDNIISQLYPASNSFLFAEGLAECYNQAKFAEFKVSTSGKAILANLRGENLVDLKCEQHAQWLDSK